MTRGMKGCYVYCTDAPLAAYLRSRLRSESAGHNTSRAAAVPAAAEDTKSNVVPLRRVTHEDRLAGVPAAPVVELRFAAGAFSGVQSLEEHASDWVELPDWIQPQPGLFVAQVVGESMNRRIPNGAWCLFGTNPRGTRQGKVVVVQHREISDPDTGGRYTVKVYRSEKVPEGEDGWRHERITLYPDSDQPGYVPIVIEVGDEGDGFVVVAELLTVIG